MFRLSRNVLGYRVRIGGFDLEGEFPLGEVAEYGYNGSGEYLGQRMQLIVKEHYEQVEENIIQNKAGDHQNEVAEKLDPPVEIGLGEYNVFRQDKTCREADTKRHYQSCIIGLDGKTKGLNIVLV